MSTSPTPVNIERVGTKTYVARSARGGEVRIGTADTADTFTPGELLHIALAACAFMSADTSLAHKLGEDFAGFADIVATKPEGDDRYDFIGTTLRMNLSSFDAEQVAAIQERALRAVEKACTVGHTVDAGTDHPVVIAHDAELPQQGAR